MKLFTYEKFLAEHLQRFEGDYVPVYSAAVIANDEAEADVYLAAALKSLPSVHEFGACRTAIRPTRSIEIHTDEPPGLLMLASGTSTDPRYIEE